MQRRRNLKNILLLLTLLIIGGVSSVGCSTSASNEKIVKVGVVGTVDNPIWQQFNRNLAQEKAHIKVEPVIFSDGIPANESLNNHQLDLNAFLDHEIATKHYHLSVIGQSYLSPLNVYSKHLHSLSQIKNGAKIAIPNNPNNAGRALKVLVSAGLIQTNPRKGDLPSLSDITQNKHHLEIVEVDPAAIMKLLPNFSAGITNSNFVQAVGLNPTKDAIYKIDPKINDPRNKPWINVIVARSSDQHNPTYKKVVQAYHSASVKKVIDKIYKGISVPAF